MINEKKFNNTSLNKTVLISPLDWGLGHATRCIPIINQLISQACIIIIAAGGDGYFLLKKEFPSLLILRTYSFKVKYSRRKRFLPFVMLLQIPQIFFSIMKDHLFLKKVIKKYNIDSVIADNRFGMYNKKIISIYITHQLLIKTGNIFTEKILQKINYYFIKKFDKCWIPDYKEKGLAGSLSHQNNNTLNVLYIGPLSRFEKSNTSEIYDLLISLSGPEPQRTIFENKILLQLKDSDKPILIARGLPGEQKELFHSNENIKIINHLSSQELNMAFLQAKIIICRSGYTTIMDLIKLSKHAILVPTSGQTEQEYLAEYLMEKKYFYSVAQDQFFITQAINNFKNFLFNNDVFEMNGYKKAVDEFVRLPKK